MNFKTLAKVSLATLLLACAVFGQATTTSTTLSAVVNAPSPNSQGTTQWCLGSATGIVLPSLASGTLGSYLAVDQEIAQVVSQGASSTCFNVKRAQLGTNGNYSHASGAVVYAGTSAVSSGDPSHPYSPGAYINETPIGPCVSTALYTTPLISTGGQTGRGNVQLGICNSSVWTFWDLGKAHTWTGTCTLGTSCAVTFPFAYTASTTYACTAADNTAADAVKIVNTSSSVVTLTGTSTDVLTYVCTGT